MMQPHKPESQATMIPRLPVTENALVTQDHESDPSAESLKSAFEMFNDISLQLADSYQMLESRVTELTSELDIVTQQRIEELQEKEQLAHRLETLINFLPGGVVVLDSTGLIVDSNPTAEQMLSRQLSGQLWRDIIQQCFAPKSDDGHEVSTHDGKRVSISTRSLDKDGQIILLTDQTETRRLQAELSRHDRLSALGKMVSALAHQVRTPLSSAMLYANHLLDSDLSSDQQHLFTQKLLGRLNHMERQVQDMLLFVKGDVPLGDKMTLTQLQSSLAEAMEMPLHVRQAKCQWKVPQGDYSICCNADALIGALLNLVNNALQAITAEPELVVEFYCNSEQQLVITIDDNGPGIDQALQHQVQEMFFTTKSQGTGIGLSVVDIVAKAHGGVFNLAPIYEAKAVVGMRATLTLPLDVATSI